MIRKKKQWIIALSLGGVIFFYQYYPSLGNSPSILKGRPEKSLNPTTPHENKGDFFSFPVSLVRPNLKLQQLEYAGQFKADLLRDMPRGTRVAITYISSFMEHSRGNSSLKDLILVETSFPNGHKYAFKASYDPRLKRIIRSWGGHHDRRLTSGFLLRK